MSLIQRRQSQSDPAPGGDGIGSRFQFDMDRFEVTPTAGQYPESEPLDDEWAADFEDLSSEFATSSDELYAGTPFVGKVFRVVDNQMRFCCAYSPERPGTIESFVRSGSGGRREGGEYRLRTTVSGHDQEIPFYVEGQDPALDVPTPSARSSQPSRLSPEQEEAVEERIRLEERANARRRYRREVEELERQVSALKDDRDRAERRLREALDVQDRLKSDVRDAQAVSAEARAEAAEARGRIVREHADELSKLEKGQFREVEKLRRELAELRQENALLELRTELGTGGGRDTLDRVLDFVGRLDVPESMLTLLATRFAGVSEGDLSELDFDPSDLSGAEHGMPPHGAQVPMVHPNPTSSSHGFPPQMQPQDMVQQGVPAQPFPQQNAPQEPEWMPPPPRDLDPPTVEHDAAGEGLDAASDAATGADVEAPDADAPDDSSPVSSMLNDVLQHALDALNHRVEMSPDQFAVWLDAQRARAESLGVDLGSAAGPLLVGLATEAGKAAVEPERVADYLAPALDRLAPNVRRFVKGPSSFLAQALCQMAEVRLPEEQMRYLMSVLDAYKQVRRTDSRSTTAEATA